MGQNFSTTTSVYVHLDSNVFFGGGTISGSIFLNALKPVQIQGLNFTIRGDERCYWEEKSHNSERSVTRYGHAVVFQVSVPVLGPGALQSGQYQFPISCQLPHSLPGSYEFNGWERACIGYEAGAELALPGFLPGMANVHHAIPIRVLQPPHIPNPISDERQEPIRHCCCINKGVIAVMLELRNNTVTPGCPITFRVAVNNNSKVPIQAVEASINHHLQMNSGMHHHRATSTRAQNRYPAESGGWSGQPGRSFDKEFVLHVPEGTPTTRAATIFQLIHTLDILLVTPGCHNYVRLSVPILINEVQPVVMGVPLPQAPPGWSTPVVYPPFQFGAAPCQPVPPPHLPLPSAPPLQGPAAGVPGPSNPAAAMQRPGQLPPIAAPGKGA